MMPTYPRSTVTPDFQDLPDPVQEAVADLKATLALFMPDLREFVIAIPEAGQLLSIVLPTVELRY